MSANDDAALIVQEADARVSEDLARALSIYTGYVRVLLIKAGGKGDLIMADNIRQPESLPLAVKVLTK